jgi:hypothetical protein
MTSTRRIDWIHPSCRDLVIEELAVEPTLQAKFVESMSLQGIKLSISDSGGLAGERQLPLMKDPRNLEILHGRCLSIAREDSDNDVIDLLTTLHSAALESPDLERRQRLIKTIGAVCKEVCVRWDASGKTIKADHLLAYCEASILSKPFSPVPQLDVTWEELVEDIRGQLIKGEDRNLLDPDYFIEWMKFAKIVASNEPRFLRAAGFPNKFHADIKRFLLLLDSEVREELMLDSASEYEAEAQRIEALDEVLNMLLGLIPRIDIKKLQGEADPTDVSPDTITLAENISEVSSRLQKRAEELKETAAELTPPEPDYEDDGSRNSSDDNFDVDGLFIDL